MNLKIVNQNGTLIEQQFLKDFVYSSNCVPTWKDIQYSMNTYLICVLFHKCVLDMTW